MKIVAIGEFLWDCLPSGKKIGGAAANFAYHARLAGADAVLVSAVGDDEDGRLLINDLAELKIPHQVQISSHYPTGTVQVVLDQQGKPTYNIVSPVAWDDIQFTEPLQELLKTADAIYFGSLIQRHANNHHLLSNIVAQLSLTTKIIVDINLRHGHYTKQTLQFSLQHGHILKLNDEELPVIARLLGLPDKPDLLFQYLTTHYSLALLLYTCGEKGSMIFSRDGDDYCAAEKITPIDTVGAGDAYTAIAAVLFLKGLPLSEINVKANCVAAYVCTQNGPMPNVPITLISDR